jgi:AcrR family transcriptional regulator
MYDLHMKAAITQPRTGKAIRSAKVVNRRGEIRDKLLDAGARLFVERGIANVSVEELIDAAGISRSTFYGFFANKNELAASILMPVFDSGIAALNKLRNLHPRQAAEGLVDMYLQLWNEHRNALLLAADFDETIFPYIDASHRAFGDAMQEALKVIDSGGLLRNENVELTFMVLAKTGIPLLRIYQNQDDLPRIYRDSMLALLIRE